MKRESRIVQGGGWRREPSRRRLRIKPKCIGAVGVAACCAWGFVGSGRVGLGVAFAAAFLALALWWLVTETPIEIPLPGPRRDDHDRRKLYVRSPARDGSVSRGRMRATRKAT